MVRDLNLYYLASAFMVVIGFVMLLTFRFLWSLPFFGGALALFFVGKSQTFDSDGGDDARR